MFGKGDAPGVIQSQAEISPCKTFLAVNFFRVARWPPDHCSPPKRSAARPGSARCGPHAGSAQRPGALRDDRHRHAGLRPAAQPPSACPAWSAWPRPTSTTAATRWRARSPAIPACPSHAATRSCSTARTSIASWPPCRITGISAWWWTPATRARISIARSPCRTPPSRDSIWSEAAQKNSRIVQIGSQRVSSALCAQGARALPQAAPSAKWRWWS